MSTMSIAKSVKSAPLAHLIRPIFGLVRYEKSYSNTVFKKIKKRS